MKVGIDIVEIERLIEKYNNNNQILDIIFTENEINYAKKYKNMFQVLAGRFAAKEAYKKILLGKSFKEIEIRNNEDGSPYYVNDLDIALSISHERHYAVAVAILNK